jgi:hypothetical protein
MGAFLTAFNAVLPLFLVIFSGILLSRSKSAGSHWVDVLNQYALKVGLPALVIASLIKIDPSTGNYATLIIVNSVWFVASMLLAFPLAYCFKLKKGVRAALVMILSYGNVAYLGIPVLNNSFGKQAVPIAGVISAVYIFWLLTFGITLIEWGNENRLDMGKLMVRQLKNPLMLSVFIGLLLVVLKINLPPFLIQTVNLFAGSVTAVVLFSLGIFLGLHSAGTRKEWGLAVIWSLVILIILPSGFWLIARKTGMDDLSMKASVLEAAMPLGLTPYAMASQYKLETHLIARVVVTSTLISMLVIPFWIIVLG